MEAFQAMNQMEEARQMLYNYFTQKKSKQWSHELERMMFCYLQMVLDGGRLTDLEEVLPSYRNCCIESNAKSLEKICKQITAHFVAKIEAAEKEAGEPLADLLATGDSTAFFLSLLSPDAKAKEQARQLWSTLQWCQRVILNTLAGIPKLCGLYCDMVRETLHICARKQVRNDFTGFCKLVRAHLRDHLHDGQMSFDEEQKLVDLRFDINQLASEIKQFGEAFEALEDIKLLSKKEKVVYQQLIRYYRALSQVFLQSDLLYYHALCLDKYLFYIRKLNFPLDEMKAAYTEFVLAVTAIPPSPAEFSINTALKTKSENLISDSEMALPTIATLRNIAQSLLNNVAEPLKELYLMMSGRADVNTFSAKLTTNIALFEEAFPLQAKHIRQNAALILFRQLGDCYSIIDIKNIEELASFLDKEKLAEVSIRAQMEKSLSLIVNARKQAIEFQQTSTTENLVAQTEVLREQIANIPKPKKQKKPIKLADFINDDSHKEYIAQQKKRIEEDEKVIHSLKLLQNKKVEEGTREVRLTHAQLTKRKLILQDKKSEVEKLLSLKPDISIVGIPLVQLTDDQILEITKDVFAELEEKLKNERKVRVKEFLEKKFKQFDHMMRVVIEKWARAPLVTKRTPEEIAEKKAKIVEQNQNLLARFKSASAFIQSFKSKVQAQTEEEYTQDLIKFREHLKLTYRAVLVSEADQIFKKKEADRKEAEKKNRQLGINTQKNDIAAPSRAEGFLKTEQRTEVLTRNRDPLLKPVAKPGLTTPAPAPPTNVL